MSNVPHQPVIAALVIATISTALSALGSSCIIIMALRNLKSTTQRILLAMSIADITLSLSILLGPFLLPSELKPYWGVSVGSFNSCKAVGFAFTMGLNTGVWYNAFLSATYLAKVRYNWNDNNNTKGPCWECMVHCAIVMVPLALSITGLVTNSFQPLTIMPICTFEKWPSNCEEDEVSPPCIVPWQVPFWLSNAGAIFMFLGVISGISCTVCLYVTAKKKMRQSSRFWRMASSSFHVTDLDNNTRRSNTGNNNPQSPFDERIRQVRNQSVLYCMVLTNTWLWPVLLSMINYPYTNAEKQEKRSDPMHIALNLMTCTLMPLQGFLNFFVYTRLKFQSWRAAYPNMGRLTVLYNIVAGKEVPSGILAVARRQERLNAIRRNQRREFVGSSSENMEEQEEEIGVLSVGKSEEGQEDTA